jgi:CheY-like chemotaxis protein
MNLIFTTRDIKLDVNTSTFFKGANISDGNYDDDIDQLIHTFIDTIINKSIKSFTLPISLSDNFLEFSGLILAHHIRLSRELEFCEVPIIFYGTLKLEQLLRLTPLARILLTDNVQYVNIVKYSFDDIQKSIEKYVPKQFDLNQFLNQIQINPPSNFDSHHSIDNEFALIQWSRYINCFNKIPQQLKKEFESQLYFKYLRVKKPLPEIKDDDQFTITTIENTRILLIDDEAKKGWGNFYESFFKNSNIKFEDSEIEFKNDEKVDLISRVESKVKVFNPDVVLLDLRLHDSDFEEEVEPKNLTGIQILEKIKVINSGIQVIITTASNKAWNFNIANQKGAFDFIIKDGNENPEKAIKKLKSNIEISAKRAKYLKNIDQKITNLKNYIKINNHFDDKDDENKTQQEQNEDKLRKRIFANLDIGYELLDLGYEILDKEKYFAYSYLQLFIIIEDYANLNSLEKVTPILYQENEQIFLNHRNLAICIIQKRDSKWYTKLLFESGKIKLQNTASNYTRKLDTNFLVSSILIYKYGNQNSSVKNWTNVYTIRNKVAHEGHTPNENEINLLIEFMLYFFDISNEGDSNIDNGLIPITYEESLQALQKKFNNR